MQRRLNERLEKERLENLHHEQERLAREKQEAEIKELQRQEEKRRERDRERAERECASRTSDLSIDLKIIQGIAQFEEEESPERQIIFEKREQVGWEDDNGRHLVLPTKEAERTFNFCIGTMDVRKDPDIFVGFWDVQIDLPQIHTSPIEFLGS
uniref:Casc1_N domain-containing protein n=2 Tax=Loa loa TaxID=7209 RepID=A0A1I7VZI7_LOALO